MAFSFKSSTSVAEELISAAAPVAAGGVVALDADDCDELFPAAS